jgi:hypothetical protein
VTAFRPQASTGILWKITGSHLWMLTTFIESVEDVWVGFDAIMVDEGNTAKSILWSGRAFPGRTRRHLVPSRDRPYRCKGKPEDAANCRRSAMKAAACLRKCNRRSRFSQFLAGTERKIGLLKELRNEMVMATATMTTAPANIPTVMPTF